MDYWSCTAISLSPGKGESYLSDFKLLDLESQKVRAGFPSTLPVFHNLPISSSKTIMNQKRRVVPLTSLLLLVQATRKATSPPPTHTHIKCHYLGQQQLDPCTVCWKCSHRNPLLFLQPATPIANGI